MSVSGRYPIIPLIEISVLQELHYIKFIKENADLCVTFSVTNESHVSSSQSARYKHIASIRIPDWCEMGTPVISAVAVFFKFMGHIVAAAHPLKQPPVFLILKFREVSYRILRRCHCRTLAGADVGGNCFIKSIAGLHRPATGCRGFFIRNNSHICR